MRSVQHKWEEYYILFEKWYIFNDQIDFKQFSDPELIPNLQNKLAFYIKDLYSAELAR